MIPLSLDLRQRIVAALETGQSQRSIAEQFAVSVASVERFARKKRDDTSLVPGTHPGKSPLVPKPEWVAFEQLAASRTDWTLQTLATAWHEQGGPLLSPSTVLRTLRRVGFTYKKSLALPRSEMPPNEKPSAPK